MKTIAISMMALFGLMVVLAGGVYFAQTFRLKPLDRAARSLAPGKFANLSDGATHYRVEGQGRGRPLIVFVHGFSTPSFVWRGIIPKLTAAGYQTLRYDLYGRGWSDRPDLRYDADLFSRQLKELLAELNIRRDIIVVGYSMGGAIAAHFAAHVQDVKGLALIAPAGLEVDQSGTGLFKIPIIGDWLFAVRGRQAILDMMALPENQGRAIPDLLPLYEQQMDYAGYLPALLSTIRHFPTSDLTAEYQQIGDNNIPTITIIGRKDVVTPISNAARLKALIPNGHIAIHDDATHAITYSEPEFVADQLIKFLDGL